MQAKIHSSFREINKAKMLQCTVMMNYIEGDSYHTLAYTKPMASSDV